MATSDRRRHSRGVISRWEIQFLRLAIALLLGGSTLGVERSNHLSWSDPVILEGHVLC